MNAGFFIRRSILEQFVYTNKPGGHGDAKIEESQSKEGVKENSWTISRFKGLGEMSADQLWETTLNPDTRRLQIMQLGRLDFDQTSACMTQLMGKGEAAARRELMEIHGDAVAVDV